MIRRRRGPFLRDVPPEPEQTPTGPPEPAPPTTAPAGVDAAEWREFLADWKSFRAGSSPAPTPPEPDPEPEKEKAPAPPKKDPAPDPAPDPDDDDDDDVPSAFFRRRPKKKTE